ncbi:hypothetical protein GGF43_006586 [Coemansia sp. RSA 2618]|nr:hypothetical protein GGF43_006586 [Coemansia sp. RSA 2618]
MDTDRPKRVQVKNACVNCQRACKKCDNARPCQRCQKYNLGDSCQDSTRKPRARGIKRGPYKKRKPRVQPELGQVSPTSSDDRAHSVPPELRFRLPPVGVFDDVRPESPLSMLSDVALHTADSEPAAYSPPPIQCHYRVGRGAPIRHMPLSKTRFDPAYRIPQSSPPAESPTRHMRRLSIAGQDP